MNEFKLQGKLTEVLPIQAGTSKAGKDWKSVDFIVEYDTKYPKKVCLKLFGDGVSLLDKFDIGDTVEVKFTPESREYNGRYFTNLSAYNISLVETVKSQQVTEEIDNTLMYPEYERPGKNEPVDDESLPF